VIPRPDVLIGNLTHVGMERSVNQDFFGFYEPEDEGMWHSIGRLLVVCDGVGGQAGGEVASQVATRAIIETYMALPPGDPIASLHQAVQAGNLAVIEEARRQPDLGDMATTAVAIVFLHGMAYIAHVGDSRCYLIRDGQLFQVTLDHSLVQQMFLEGLIAEEEMETHPRKNVILRSIGMKPDVEIDVQSHPYVVDDLFMLSSDGLTGMVNKQECLEVSLRHFNSPMHACRELVDLANYYGGYDNITVQIARVMGMTPEEGYGRLQNLGLLGGENAAPQEPTMGLSDVAPRAATAPKIEKGRDVTGVFSEEDLNKAKAEAAAKQNAAAEAKKDVPRRRSFNPFRLLFRRKK
jgi:serine/threonine protein phosphatase PrpC